jgi:hypothetical protein
LSSERAPDNAAIDRQLSDNVVTGSRPEPDIALSRERTSKRMTAAFQTWQMGAESYCDAHMTTVSGPSSFAGSRQVRWGSGANGAAELTNR